MVSSVDMRFGNYSAPQPVDPAEILGLSGRNRPGLGPSKDPEDPVRIRTTHGVRHLVIPTGLPFFRHFNDLNCLLDP